VTFKLNVDIHYNSFWTH